ncbi:MAG: DUF6036 family nucleotidyltransferase [archaeon]
MINTKDQEDLFRLIADYLKTDVSCIAIGGTAMMFSGYKTATKDIDLVFRASKERQIFIMAIEELGYMEKSLSGVYDEKRKALSSKPKLFSRGEERFDLFAQDVFGFSIGFLFNSILQRHDFIGKKELSIIVPSKESLMLLKSVTGRDTDYEDIETIVKTEKTIDWEKIINDAISQKKNMPWILIDLEQTLKKLKKITFIKQNFFDMIYKAQEGK